MKATITPGLTIPPEIGYKFDKVTNQIFEQVNSVYASHGQLLAVVHVGKGKNKKVFSFQCQFERTGQQLHVSGIGNATDEEAAIKFNAKDPAPAIVRI